MLSAVETQIEFEIDTERFFFLNKNHEKNQIEIKSIFQKSFPREKLFFIEVCAKANRAMISRGILNCILKKLVLKCDTEFLMFLDA